MKALHQSNFDLDLLLRHNTHLKEIFSPYLGYELKILYNYTVTLGYR